MRKLLVATMMMLLAPAVRGERAAAPATATDAPDDVYVHELDALIPSQVEAKKIGRLPTMEDSKRINLKQHIHSASFGYRVTIIVPKKGGHMERQFYVEHSGSTNRPEVKWFGPFPLR
jgi:hypothetical protein